MHKVKKLLELGGTKKEIVFLVLSALALIASLFRIPLPFDAAWIAIVLCGVPIVLEAAIGLVTAFDIKADLLVSLALIASIAIGEHFAAGEVAFIMQLGALLEGLTVARARAGIEKLVNMTPRTARVIGEGSERVIPAQQVRVGDWLRVLPGETIPVDGVISAGQTSINQAVMTGESLPVDKTVGDEVASGTVNQFGSFDMKATRVGEDSSIQRMVRLVQSADAGKAKIVGLADRWATWIVVIALTAAALTWGITGEMLRAVTILVVFCPCALVLATPAAIMAAMGNASKHGFLVREGDALERLASVCQFTFDKTGTLTFGRPQVIHVHSFIPDMTEEALYTLAARTELRSEHPLGKAIVRGRRAFAKEQFSVGKQVSAGESSSAMNSAKELRSEKKQIFAEELPSAGKQISAEESPSAGKQISAEEQPTVLERLIPPEEFRMLPGLGVQALVDGRMITAGSLELMMERQIPVSSGEKAIAASYLIQGCTVVYLAVDGRFAGFLALADTLRPQSAGMIAQIKRIGVCPVLLTGDHDNPARHIAEQLDIDKVCANCLPEDKLSYIVSCEKEKSLVCMVGDGINDAPALKRACVGIAMGGIGSDIAVDAADIALISDDIQEIPHLLQLAKRMMWTIKCNLTFSMILNLVAILLAMTGVLNPVVGALVHNAGSVAVIVNSALLLKWRKK